MTVEVRNHSLGEPQGILHEAHNNYPPNAFQTDCLEHIPALNFKIQGWLEHIKDIVVEKFFVIYVRNHELNIQCQSTVLRLGLHPLSGKAGGALTTGPCSD